MKQANERREREIEERARELFAGSVSGLDGATRSRLRMARARAVEAAARPRPGWGLRTSLVPLGGLAAALLAVAVFWPGPPVAVEPVAANVLTDLDILLDGESLDLFEDLEFYAWLLEQPDVLVVPFADDGDG